MKCIAIDDELLALTQFKYRLLEQQGVTLASLQKMEERLPTHFMRVHRSYIVNLRKITEVSRLRIIFDKNTYIPVGDNYKKKFTEYIGKLSFS